MSSAAVNITQLLEAAKYLDQQEKLSSSVLYINDIGSNSSSINNNNSASQHNRNNATTTTTPAIIANGHGRNGIVPAVFTNGGGIGGSSGSLSNGSSSSNSQLALSHDYEFNVSNSNGQLVGILETAVTSRNSEGRSISEDEYSSSNSSPKQQQQQLIPTAATTATTTAATIATTITTTPTTSRIKIATKVAKNGIKRRFDSGSYGISYQDTLLALAEAPTAQPQPALKHRHSGSGVGGNSSNIPRKYFICGDVKQPQQQQQQQQQQSNTSLLGSSATHSISSSSLSSSSPTSSMSPTTITAAAAAAATATIGTSSTFKISSDQIFHTIAVRQHQQQKSLIPLTPPPTAVRTEMPSRIRSYSLPSHKLSAQHQQQQQQHQSGGMIIDDAHMSYVGSVRGAGNSPPSRSSNYTHLLATQQQQQQQQQQGTPTSSPVGSQLTTTHVASGRRRTISSNSNGAGTREVHNKLEKNRRAHLKECYELLKSQLPLKDEDRKKTSNLAILDHAVKFVTQLSDENRRQEITLEREAQKKIKLQKRLNILKRVDTDQCIPVNDKDVNEPVCLASTSAAAAGRGAILFDGTTSPVCTAGQQTAVPTAISPVINKTSSNSKHHNNNNINASGAAINPNAAGSYVHATHNNSNGGISLLNSNAMGLLKNSIVTHGSATAATGNHQHHISPAVSPTSQTGISLTRGSPTPSTPSPSSSSSGVSSSASFMSTALSTSCGSSSSPSSSPSSSARSSPPMQTHLISARKVSAAIAMPNVLKFHTSTGSVAAAGNAAAGINAGATIVAASAPGTASSNGFRQAEKDRNYNFLIRSGTTAQ